MRGSNAARDQATLAARRDAHDLAMAVRSALRQPGILELCDPAHRFAVDEGQLQVDPSVGWLDRAAARPLPPKWQLLLDAAQRAEFGDADPAAARAHFDALLGELREQDPRECTVLGLAAWQAYRAHDAARTKQLHDRIAASLRDLDAAALGDPHTAGAVSSVELLAAALDSSEGEPRRLSPLAEALPAVLGQATLQRLAEFGATIDPSHESRLLENVARRRVLRTAAAFLRDAAHLGPVQAFAGQLVLWFPGNEEGKGRGAVVPPEWLVHLPEQAATRSPDTALTPIPDRGTVTLEASARAEPVVASLAWAAPPPLPSQPWFAQPTAITSAGLGLLLLFAATVWTTMRGLARENTAMRARTEFLSGVTHELKTPVAAMRLIADVLHDDDVRPERQREYFTMLASESARLSALIDNVLDLGQIERGERSYDKRDDDLAAVVREAIDSYRPLAQQAGIDVALDERATTAVVELDRGALIQAMLNLLENARKYASSGKRIEVATAIADGAFVARVRDFGRGIPDGEREAIFHRFRRGATEASGSIAGVGLGLFLSRSILEAHGGTLTCLAPEDGPGSVFQLTVPLQPGSAHS